MKTILIYVSLARKKPVDSFLPRREAFDSIMKASFNAVGMNDEATWQDTGGSFQV